MVIQIAYYLIFDNISIHFQNEKKYTATKRNHSITKQVKMGEAIDIETKSYEY